MKPLTLEHDRQELLKHGQELVRNLKPGRLYERVVCVNLLLAGSIAALELSDATGIPIRTLQSWVTDVDQKGWDSLEEPHRPGLKSRLSAADKAEIRKILTDNKPRKYGYYAWDTWTVAEYIQKTYDIKYGQSATTKLLKELGVTLKRPPTNLFST